MSEFPFNSHSMDVGDVSKQTPESSRIQTDLNDISSGLKDAKLVTKRKIYCAESSMINKNLNAVLDVERDFSNWASMKIIELQRERSAALLDAHVKKGELEIMERRALDAERTRKELERVQKKIQDDEWRRYEEFSVESRAPVKQLRQAITDCQNEMHSMRERANTLKTDFDKALVSTLADKTQLETAVEAMQRSLQKETEGKEKMEMAHQAELQQAQLERQNLVRELQQSTNARGKAEAELSTLQQVHNRLKVALERMQEELDEVKQSKLCSICRESPKDVIRLPCVHAEYCFRCLERHRQNSRSCPTCRTILNGVLKFDIGL